MERPADKESPERTRERLLYHAAQLRGAEQEEATALLDPTRALLARYDAHLQARALRSDSATEAQALRDRRDQKADRLLGRFDLALLGLVERKRDDARFMAVYQGKNLTGVRRLPFAEQADFMEGMASALDRPELAPLQAEWQATLRQHAQALREAQATFQAAVQQRDALHADAALLRLETKRLLELNYADLLKLYPHSGEAEDFFLSML